MTRSRDAVRSRHAMHHEALDALADCLHALSAVASTLACELGPDRDGALDEAPPAPLDDASARHLAALPALLAAVIPTLARDADARRGARAHARLVDAMRTLDARLRRHDPRYDDVPHERVFLGPTVRQVYALRELVETRDDEVMLVVDLPTGAVMRCRAHALRSNFELMTALEGPDATIDGERLVARHDYFTWQALTRTGDRFAAERIEHRLWGDDRPCEIPRFEGVTVVLRARTTRPARSWCTWVIKPLDPALHGRVEVDARLSVDDAAALLARMAAEALTPDLDDAFDRALAASAAPRAYLLPTGPDGPAHCHFGVPHGFDYAGRFYNGLRPLVVMPPNATRLSFEDVKRQGALLAALFASRHARIVARLVVGTTSHVHDEDLHGDDDAYHTADFDAVIALLAEARLPALKRLSLGAHERHHNADLDLVGSLGELSPVLAALSHIEELSLLGRFELSAPVVLPALRRFDVTVADHESHRGPLSNDTLQRWLTMRAPSLTHATLRLDGLFDDEVPTYTLPAAFLEGEGMPSLREMLLYGRFSPDEVRRLQESPLARRARIDVAIPDDSLFL